MSARIPIHLSNLPLREEDEGSFLTVNFYDNREDGKYNECDLVINTDPGFGAYEMQVEVSDGKNGMQTFYTNHVGIRIGGAWERTSLIEALSTILQTYEVVTKIDK